MGASLAAPLGPRARAGESEKEITVTKASKPESSPGAFISER
jgi:hypothetical protein